VNVAWRENHWSTLLRKALLYLVVLLVLGFASEAFAVERNVSKIAAVVNGEMITVLELQRNTLAEMARRRMPPDDPRRDAVQFDILDSMINDILIRQEAKRYKVAISDAEIEAELERNISRSGIAPEKFDAELKSQGYTRQQYKERLGNMMLRQRMTTFMIARKVFVTPAEVADYYDKNKAEMVSEKTVDFSVIVLPEKLPVKSIYDQMRSGSLKFEEAARKYSADRSAAEGGKLAAVPWDKMPPDMQRLLGSLADGQMSPLLRTQGGFVILRRDTVKEAKALSLQEAAPRIEEILKAPLLEERFKEYTSQLRSKAVIDIRI
jgi:peptidyl-prolyl cis-trans isomerase SurA